MALSTQQAEALQFFDHTSSEWRLKAEGKLERVNIIAQRHNCAHRIWRQMSDPGSMLDIGCGTGELVLEMAGNGADATGIDFAPAMIRACEEKRDRLGARNARFHCCSIFEHDAPDDSQDLISAMGFIEYISPAQLTALLDLSHRVLRKNGRLALGSRNRIFNLFSLNEYTTLEQSLGTVNALMREALVFGQAPDMQSALDNAAATPLLPQPTSHPGTGIGVAVRYQYTPGELASLLARAGFAATAAYPVHYHAIPPRVGRTLKGLHVSFSNAVFDIAAEEHTLIPFSSSFVIAARKL